MALRFTASAIRSRLREKGRKTAGTYRYTKGVRPYGVSRWRAGPDSNRLPPAVLRVCFRKHLLPVLRSLCQLRLCGIFLQPRDLLF